MGLILHLRLCRTILLVLLFNRPYSFTALGILQSDTAPPRSFSTIFTLRGVPGCGTVLAANSLSRPSFTKEQKPSAVRDGKRKHRPGSELTELICGLRRRGLRHLWLAGRASFFASPLPLHALLARPPRSRFSRLRLHRPTLLLPPSFKTLLCPSLCLHHAASGLPSQLRSIT